MLMINFYAHKFTSGGQILVLWALISYRKNFELSQFSDVYKQHSVALYMYKLGTE